MAAFIVKPGEGNALNVLGMPLRFLCGGNQTDGAWSLMEEEIALGQGPAVHRHDWDEAYYVIDGALDFEIDGRAVHLAAGQFACLPRNTWHGFRGAAAAATHVLIFAAPAHSSAFFEDVNREIRDLPQDLVKMPEIGRRHGIEFRAE